MSRMRESKMIDKEVAEKMSNLSQNLTRMLEMTLHGFGP